MGEAIVQVALWAMLMTGPTGGGLTAVPGYYHSEESCIAAARRAMEVGRVDTQAAVGERNGYQAVCLPVEEPLYTGHTR